MERRRRHGPGDHLSGELSDLLLSPAEALAIDAHGSKDAAVLVPIFDWPDDPSLIFTERRHDLRRHAGEISFPGGRVEGDESLLDCALRESQEEIGLDPATVEVVGALQPTSTIVTSYKVVPFVGLVPAGLQHTPQPTEVEQVIELRLSELRAGYAKRRLIRRGVPFRTATFAVDDHMIWGATARMLETLFERLDS
ncbi:MAG: NUDIX hydrolase [Solirubrobacterales bacterium]